MISMKKIGLLMCGALAAAVITTGFTATDASAASRKYVKSISDVKVGKDKVRSSGTYHVDLENDSATFKVSEDVNADKGASKGVTYSSSNRKVATVSSSGKITVKKEGTATITITSKGKNKSGDKVTYRFKLDVTDVSLSASLASTKLYPDQMYDLPATTLTVKSEGIESLKVTSSNTDIVSVQKKRTNVYTISAEGDAGLAYIKISGKSEGTGDAYSITKKITIVQTDSLVIPEDSSEITGITVSNVSFNDGASLTDLLYTDLPAIASKLDVAGLLGDDYDFTITINGYAYTATYDPDSKSMSYSKGDGTVVEIGDDFLDDREAADVTLTFPGTTNMADILSVLQEVKFTSHTYDISFDYAEEDEDSDYAGSYEISNLRYVNGYLYFTTDGISYKASIKTYTDDEEDFLYLYVINQTDLSKIDTLSSKAKAALLKKAKTAFADTALGQLLIDDLGIFY